MNNFNDENQCKGWYKLVLVEFEKNLQIKKKLWQQKEEFLKWDMVEKNFEILALFTSDAVVRIDTTELICD